MFAAKPTIPYPPAGRRWNIGFARLFDFIGIYECAPHAVFRSLKLKNIKLKHLWFYYVFKH
jgi:hypothetical protein